jgi:hypothetical protein
MKGFEMNTAKDKLLAYWNEKPIESLLIGAAVATAASKLIDALSAAQGRRAYAKQVDHRVRKNR